MQVLIADDDPLFAGILRELVRSFGHECVIVGDGGAAWQHLLTNGADVVISDWQMPGLTGVQLCQMVRDHPEISYPYFIVLSAQGSRHDVLAAVRAGADDHVTKPPDLDDLEARLIVAERVRALQVEVENARRELEQVNAKLYEAAHRDVLTGLGNRLRLNEDLPAIHARFARQGYPYHVVMLDIDHFKAYNDTLGHQAGDALLAAVGRAITTNLRLGDEAYRYGGEEFLLILPNRSLDEAALGAERIRRAIGAATSVGSLPKPATLSAGLAGVVAGETPEQVVNRADKALYRAKDGGRDQLVVDTA